MKLIILISYFFGSVLLVNNANSFNCPAKSDSNQQILKFNLSTNKDLYIEGEPVIVRLTITNIGSKKDSVSYRNYHAFFNGLNLTTDSELKISHAYEIDEFSIIPYNKLKSNESISKYIELQEYFGTALVYPETEDVNFKYYLNEGQYNLYYKGSQNKRKYESNMINFEVKKPEGINLKIFNEMLNVFKMKEWSANRNEQVERYEAILKILDTYPPNPYTEKLFPELNSHYPYLDEYKYDIFEKNLWFIDNYPDSFFLDYIIEYSIDYAYNFHGGMKGVDELTAQINSKHHDSRAALLAEQFRKNYK